MYFHQSFPRSNGYQTNEANLLQKQGFKYPLGVPAIMTLHSFISALSANNHNLLECFPVALSTGLDSNNSILRLPSTQRSTSHSGLIFNKSREKMSSCFFKDRVKKENNKLGQKFKIKSLQTLMHPPYPCVSLC